MGGEGREGKGRERSALGRVGNCLGPARGKNCGASGRVKGAHLRVQLHPVLERFDAELPLAAHRVVSSNTILRHLLRAPRGDLASAPRCEFLLLFFREGTRRMEKNRGDQTIDSTRGPSRAIFGSCWVRFTSCSPADQVEPVGRFRFRDPTPRQTVHARDAAARTKARQHHAHTSTHLHKARDEVEGDGYAPEPAAHARDPAPRLTSESGAPRARPRSSPGTGR